MFYLGGVNMKESFDAWFKFLSARKANTARTYRVHLGQFFDWLQDRPLTRYEIEDYITYCLEERYAKITINGKIAAVQSFCKWYCPRHDLPDPSTTLRHFAKADTKPEKQRFLTTSEYGKVLLAAEAGVELDTVEFLANTGLRRNEFVQFQARDMTPDGSHLIVRWGKGNKERKVPVNSKLRQVMDRSRHEDGSLRCVTYWKGRGNGVWEACQSLARRAEISAFGPHALRHYFATTLIKKGVPIKMVSQILGHSSVVITEQTYCHLLPEDTTGITECLCD
jgi:site-specific recombinase XerD